MRIPTVHEFHMKRAEPKDKFDYETIQVELKPSQYVDDLGLFENEKELHKFVVRTKYLIRHSLEYSQLMKFLKKKRGMWCCGVHPNIKSWDGYEINIHHTPLVMEDLIYIVINKRLKMQEPMKQTSIAKEIMYLHYLGLIGLYPLCQVCHSYAHGDTNDLFIPLDSIFGDPEKFFEIYSDFITNVMKIKFRNVQELNKGYTLIRQEIPDALTRKYIYVTEKGQEMVSTKALYSFIKEINEIE